MQLIGFHPRSLLDDISEHARLNIYATVQGIEGWAGGKSSGLGEAVEREVDIVSIPSNLLCSRLSRSVARCNTPIW